MSFSITTVVISVANHLTRLGKHLASRARETLADSETPISDTILDFNLKDNCSAVEENAMP